MKGDNGADSVLLKSENVEKEAVSCLKSIKAIIWSRDRSLGIKLKPEAEPIHYLSYLIFLMVTFSSFYYLDITLIFLLRHPDYYGLKEAEVIETTGNLVFYRSLVRILTDPLAGSMHDLVSRKYFIIISVVLTVPVFLLIPRCGQIYPNFLFAFLFLGILMSNIYTTPIVNDLVANTSLGLSMAMINLVIDLSRVFAVYVFFKMNQEVSIGATMVVVSICMGILSLYLCKGFKSTPIINSKSRNVLNQMWNALKYAKEHPVFGLYFSYNTLSYVFTYLSSTYMAIFVSSFFDSSSEGIKQAQSLATSIKGTGNILNVIVSGAFGFLADHVPEALGVTFTCVVMASGAIGFVLLGSCKGADIYVCYSLLVIGLLSSRVMVLSALLFTDIIVRNVVLSKHSQRI